MNDEYDDLNQRHLLCQKIVVVNIGLNVFEDSLRNQGVETVVVKWEPSHQIKPEIEDLLQKLT